MFTTQAHLRLHGERLIELEDEAEEEWRSGGVGFAWA